MNTSPAERPVQILLLSHCVGTFSCWQSMLTPTTPNSQSLRCPNGAILLPVLGEMVFIASGVACLEGFEPPT